jgi:Adaptin C-terminal domain
MDLEVQQRACEYSMLLSSRMETVCVLVMGRMPPMDYVAARKRISEAAAIVDGSSAGHQRPVPFSDTLLSLLDEDLGEARPSRLSLHGTSDQLALSAPSGGASLATTDADERSLEHALAVSSKSHPNSETVVEAPSISNRVDRETNGSDPLPNVGVLEESSRNRTVSNLPLQTSTGAEPSKPVAHSANAELASGIVGSVDLLETGFISISVKFYKEDASDLGRTRADFEVRNRSSVPLDKFVLQLAVPKYMKAEMKPATSSTVMVGGQISQSVILVNSLHGSKPVQLRYRAQFAPRGSDDVLEQGVANGLPVDL